MTVRRAAPHETRADLEREWPGWLANADTSDWEAADSADRLRALWCQMLAYGFKVPTACGGIEEHLAMHWDSEAEGLRLHFDVGFEGNGPVEWFFRNRITEEYAGGECEGMELPEEALAYARSVMAAIDLEGSG